jgi:hypothetical protein
VKKRELFQVLLVCSVLFSVNLVFVLSQPITSPVVVAFGSSAEEDRAIEILREELTGVVVTKYDSAEFQLLKQRSYGPMVMVAHGVGAGFESGGVDVPTSRIVSDIMSTPASAVYLLACESGAIAAEDLSGRAIGFDYPIDAELASLSVVVRIQLSYGQVDSAVSTFSRFIMVLDSKVSGECAILPLMPIEGGGGGGGGGSSPPPAPTPVFSYQEQQSLLAMFLGGCVMAVAGFAVGMIIGRVASASSATASRIGNRFPPFVTLVNWIKAQGPTITNAANYGARSILNGLTVFCGGVIQMATTWIGVTIETLLDAMSRMNVGEWALFLTVLGMELLVVIVTAGMEAIARLEAGLVIVAFNCAIVGWVDISDSNSVPCKSLIDAISQICA